MADIRRAAGRRRRSSWVARTRDAVQAAERDGGDPPLQQVVTRTFEAGVRGSGEHGLRWSAGWFRATNHDDILFVASQQTGFGYFKNFETTRRQGLELDMSARAGRVTYGGGYTFCGPRLRAARR